MSKEDYFKYYIQGSDHYLIPKDIFDELFNEMENWKKDTQKQKEVIDKLKEYIEEHDYDYIYMDCKFIETEVYKDLQNILKEVE